MKEAISHFVLAIVPDNPAFYNDPMAAVAFGLIILKMLLTVSVIAVIVWKAKHPVIRRSSPIFCVLILIGLLCIELSFFFFCFEQSVTTCHLNDWFVITGVSLVVANLLAKSYRIYRIFNNRSAVAVKLSDWELLAFSALTLLVALIMMVLYVTLGGGLEAVEIQSESDFLYVYVDCRVPNNTFQLLFIIAFYAYFVLLFCAAALLAFLNRKVSNLYSESKAVGLTVYLWLGLLILYAPIFYVQGGSTDSNQTRLVVRFIATMLACMFTLVLLFLPKIRQVFQHDHRDRRLQ